MLQDRDAGVGRAPLFLTVPAVLVALIALVPIGYLVLRSSQAGGVAVADIVLRERTLTLIGRSLALASAVTVACLVVGIGLAFLVVRTDLPGASTVATVAPLPLAIPSYVAAFAWVSAVPNIDGFLGAWLVLTLCSYPFVFLPVAAALRRADPAVEEVARSLGRSPLRTFGEVTLRQIGPAAGAGGLLVSLYALSDFGAVSILRFDAFTRVIHTSYQASFDRRPAAVLGLVLVVVTILISVGESRFRRRDAARVGSGVSRAADPVRLTRWRLPSAAGVWALLALAMGYPVGSLLWWFATGLSAGLDWPRLISSGVATATLSGLGALACLVGAVPVGILAARHRGRFATVIEQATYAGHALPGLVVALSLISFGVSVVPWLYQEVPLLVLAYVVLFLPAAVGVVRSSVELSPVRLEEVARSLGATAAQALRRVTLPLSAPGIGAGAALTLITCMKELPATLLLRPTGVDTLATRIWSETGVGAYAAAAPYGLALVVLTVVPTFALMRIYARDGGPR